MSLRFRMSACIAAVAAVVAWAYADPPQNADVIGGEEGIPFINDGVTFDPAANCECNTVNDRLGASDCAPGEFCLPTACTPIVGGCGGGRACNGECFVFVELFNNLPDDYHIPGGGAGGFDVNPIWPGETTFGNNTLAASFHQADDFVVPTGETWTLNTGSTWLYQTNASTSEPITDLFIQIWNGVPGAGGVVIAGDMTTDRLLLSAFSGTYRTTDADRLNTARAIKHVTFDLSFVPPLTEGSYWIEFASNGNTSFSGPWQPVRTPTRVGVDNGRFLTVSTNTWADSVDASSGHLQDRPFVLYGEGQADPCADNACVGSFACTFKKLVCKNAGAKLISKGVGTAGDSVCVLDGAGNFMGCATVNDRGKWKNVEKNVGGGSKTRSACGDSKSTDCL
ncbi:MAG: hypothetical protein IT449_16580 [Phycisphaerales bacterium]|nr:hypothetical protein [Phycisphaerales bacterium]